MICNILFVIYDLLLIPIWGCSTRQVFMVAFVYIYLDQRAFQIDRYRTQIKVLISEL